MQRTKKHLSLQSPPRKHLLCFSRNQFYYLGFSPFLSETKYSASFSSEVYVQMWCSERGNLNLYKILYLCNDHILLCLSFVCRSDFHSLIVQTIKWASAFILQHFFSIYDLVLSKQNTFSSQNQSNLGINWNTRLWFLDSTLHIVW